MPTPKHRTALCTSSPHYAKREHYGLHYLLASHPIIRRIRRAERSQLHGNKNWGAAFLLMEYLNTAPLEAHTKVLEIGCGWGLGSLYCAKTFHCDALATDADQAVFSFLEAQAKANHITLPTEQRRFADFTAEELGSFDTLIASDICFWDDMAEEVYQTITRAVEGGCGRIIIADPGRPPFLQVAEACVDDFFAEILPIEARSARRHRGWVLNIENR